MKRIKIELRLFVIALLTIGLSGCVEDVTQLGDPNDFVESGKDEDDSDDELSDQALQLSDVEAYFAFDGNLYDSSPRKVLLMPLSEVTSVDQMTYDFAAEGVSSRAVNMNGYQVVTNGLKFDAGAAFTVAASIFAVDLDVEQIFVESSIDPSKGISLKLTADNKVSFSLAGVEVVSENYVEPSTWCNVVVTYDGRVVNLYVNGEVVAATDVVSSKSIQQLRIAHSLEAGTLLDELILVSKSIDSEDVEELLKSGISLVPIRTVADLTKYLPASGAIDVTGSPTDLPSTMSIKRGVAAPGQNGFFDSEDMRKFLDLLANCNITLFNGIRNIYKDQPYTNEFYRDENGVFRTQQIDKFTDIRVYAAQLGIEMISQVGGSPVYDVNSFDEETQQYGTLFREDPLYIYNKPIDYAPLPDVEMIDGETVSPYDEFVRCFKEWSVAADQAVRDKIGDQSYRSIWIGTQEVTHTLGYPADTSGDAYKQVNNERYIDFWKEISDHLHENGIPNGAIQLNSSNSETFVANAEIIANLGLKIDYFTVQFYQWGTTVDLERAVEAVKRYNELTGRSAKVIIDRGNYQKSSIASRQSFLRFLRGEKVVMDNADDVYGYTLEIAVNQLVNGSVNYKRLSDIDLVEQYCRLWMNKLGDKRLPITLPEKMNGFMTKDGEALIGAIWNGNGENDMDDWRDPEATIIGEKRELTIELSNCEDIPSDAKLSVRRFSGLDKSVSLTDKSNNNPVEILDINAQWNPLTKTISGLKLDNDEYLLIELR